MNPKHLNHSRCKNIVKNFCVGLLGPVGTQFVARLRAPGTLLQDLCRVASCSVPMCVYVCMYVCMWCMVHGVCECGVWCMVYACVCACVWCMRVCVCSIGDCPCNRCIRSRHSFQNCWHQWLPCQLFIQKSLNTPSEWLGAWTPSHNTNISWCPPAHLSAPITSCWPTLLTTQAMVRRQSHSAIPHSN